MAIIHNKLYRSLNYDKVDFDDYVKTLTQNLYLSFGADASRIDLQINLNGTYLNIDTAIPCGLIINELISNSLKYAFPGDRSGKILVKMNSKGDDVELTVKDDGIGISKDIQLTNTDTLGLKLVQLLTMQMDGQVEIIRLSPGTEFKIKFKELVYKQRTL
jgi:two-component sensor histidine kinase